MESRYKQQKRFDVLGLFCKAASRDSKRSPAKIVSTRS